MSDVFCKQCGVTDDQQAKCDDGSGVFYQECDEFIDVEEDTEEGKMNYRKKARQIHSSQKIFKFIRSKSQYLQVSALVSALGFGDYRTLSRGCPLKASGR